MPRLQRGEVLSAWFRDYDYLCCFSGAGEVPKLEIVVVKAVEYIMQGKLASLKKMHSELVDPWGGTCNLNYIIFHFLSRELCLPRQCFRPILVVFCYWVKVQIIFSTKLFQNHGLQNLCLLLGAVNCSPVHVERWGGKAWLQLVPGNHLEEILVTRDPIND